jgi:hypothetical protein
MCAAAAEYHARIGKGNYSLSGDGLLMPAKKGQAPPDLRYFRAKPVGCGQRIAAKRPICVACFTCIYAYAE